MPRLGNKQEVIVHKRAPTDASKRLDDLQRSNYGVRKAETRSPFCQIHVWTNYGISANQLLKKLSGSSEPKRSFLLQSFVDIYQSNPIKSKHERANEFGALKEDGWNQDISNKELRITKKILEALVKSKHYFEPISKKSCQYESGIDGLQLIHHWILIRSKQ